MSARSSRRLMPVLVVGLALVLVVAIAAVISRPETGTGEPVGNSVPVALTAQGLPRDTSIGVILSLGSAQGSAWKDAAQGAAVAAHRLAAGGSPVILETRDDRGTSQGARDAVAELAAQKVAGIVLATSGEHVPAALQAAQEAGIPVLLPYYSGELSGFDTAYSLTPGPQPVSAAMKSALGEAGHVMLIDLGGPAPEGINPAERRAPAAGDDLNTLAVEVSKLAAPQRGEPVDAVLITGPATRQAAMVHALQQRNISLPLVLGPAATSPGFESALHEAGGSASSRLLSVGTGAVDAAALRPGDEGRAMSGFLAAVRVMAEDPQVMNLTGDQPFAKVAPVAEAHSHDAVIALVHAAAHAKSGEPGAVAGQLDKLSLQAGHGIAGGDLDLGRDADQAQAVVLHLASQDLGLRPAPSGARTPARWFAGPAGN